MSLHHKPEPEIYALSEYALTVEYGHEISSTLSRQVLNLDAWLRKKPFPGFQATVPAYATLSIYYDPHQVIRSPLRGVSGFDKVASYVRSLLPTIPDAAEQPCRHVVIPVCYGGSFGPDLPAMAASHQLSVQDVIDLHSRGSYYVYMMGFIPGFAYLGGLPDILTTPRRPLPRPAVSAGSVGIAGNQTGIYPLESPGGWQIIGRTPLTLFNARRSEPALLQSGDQVSFKPITEREYSTYDKNRHETECH